VPITYHQALRLAVERDPRLKLYDALAEAADGQIEQASLRPNPVVGAEFENLLESGALRGVQSIQATLGISQLIETADKREKHAELALRERDLIDWNREARLTELAGQVRGAFVEVLIAQKERALRQELHTLAENSEAETKRLVEAARSPKVELTRAQLAIRQQQFFVERARQSVNTAKTALASLWGLERAPEFEIAGVLKIESRVPPIEELIALIPETTPLARFEAETGLRDAALKLEESKAKPDFEIFAGARYMNEDNGNSGFLAGIEIPWPRFDKNQGNIRTARAMRFAIEHERDAAFRELLIALASAHSQLQTAHAETIALTSDLLPAAEQALSDTEEGYRRGQFTLLDVLDTRRTLFNIREAYLDALSRYARAQAAIETLSRPALVQR
jgi:cobalt-zinc-cadmium efflux system outer membrane protein